MSKGIEKNLHERGKLFLYIPHNQNQGQQTLKPQKRGLCVLGGVMSAQWKGQAAPQGSAPERGRWEDEDQGAGCRQGRGGNRSREASRQEDFWGGKREWRSLSHICVSWALGYAASSCRPCSDEIFGESALLARPLRSTWIRFGGLG